MFVQYSILDLLQEAESKLNKTLITAYTENRKSRESSYSVIILIFVINSVIDFVW